MGAKASLQFAIDNTASSGNLQRVTRAFPMLGWFCMRRYKSEAFAAAIAVTRPGTNHAGILRKSNRSNVASVKRKETMHKSINPWFSSLVVAGIFGASSSADAEQTNNTTATNVVQSTNAIPARTSPEHGGFGIGVILGAPTGLSMKYWLSNVTAVDLGAAWSFQNPGSFQLNSDFLFHKFDLFPIKNGELPLYFGAGGSLDIPTQGDTRFGLRLPVGIAYEFRDMPIEVFAEVAPIVDLTPATQLRWNGGVGVRFYFR
jgi:hypothetical protein